MSKIHVLVVEDSPTQAARLRADLEANDFEVTLARHGAEALELLEATHVDVIASDVVMPGMSGYELCRHVKDDPRHRETPVVLLTSLTDPLEVVNGLESGADNFIRKPYERDLLTARLRAAVHNRDLRRSGRFQMGIQLSFLDREFDITADRQQILDLLISTFEELVVTSRAVRQRERELETAHTELEQQFRLVELERKRLHAVVEAVPVPLFVTDPDLVVSYASEATERGLQVNPVAAVGNRLDEVIELVDADGEPVPAEQLPFHLAVADSLPASRGEAFDLYVNRQDGTRVPLVLEASPVFDDGHRPVGCVTTAHTLGGLTEHDARTGLPNAAAFLDRAAVLLAGHHGRSGLLLLELDRFLVAGAALPPATRNELLVAVSRRLRVLFEPGEDGAGENTFLAHLGGHRFGVLLTRLPDSFRVVHLAESARRTIAEGYAGREAGSLTASVGVALDDGDNPGAQLFAAASEALSRAQAAGGNRVEILGAEAARDAMHELALETDLRDAIENDDITLDYQPEYDVETGLLVGFEALARWRHPELGPVPPPVFIGLAERSGSVLALGRQLLLRACRDAVAWQDWTGVELSVSVNVSAIQLRREFVPEVLAALDDTGLDPRLLVLEVTETAALVDPATTVPVIEELKRHGIRFALDDFGTGYSSLTQLTQVRFDQLKLDRSFVASIMEGGTGAVVARSVIALGASLRIPVVAEGVETHEQLAELRALGCRLCQGYLLSRPVPGDRLEAFLEQHGTRTPEPAGVEG